MAFEASLLPPGGPLAGQPHRQRLGAAPHRGQQAGVCRAASAPARSAAKAASKEVEEAKLALQDAVAFTERGGLTTSSTRAEVAEAQLALEAFGGDLDYGLLEGLWRMVYTTARDVAPLVQGAASPFSPVRVGGIFQRFSSPAVGDVENLIQLSVPPFLQEGDGVTVKVKAQYSVQSARRIRLRFSEAGLGDVKITPLTEALIAPAALPRGWLQQQLILFLKEFRLRVPLRSSLPAAERTSQEFERTFGSDYLLTFLDKEMLVGRQTGSGGTFIFLREA